MRHKTAQDKSHATSEMLTHRITGKASLMKTSHEQTSLLFPKTRERWESLFLLHNFHLDKKKIQQTTMSLYWFLSKQHWGKYNYLKQAYEALQCVQKGLHGYPWLRIKLWQGKEILPLLLNTIHWHGFLIFWRSTSLQIHLQTYSIPAYEAWVQVSLYLAACASAHISIMRVAEERTIRKREINEYNLMALCSRAWSEKV